MTDTKHYIMIAFAKFVTEKHEIYILKNSHKI